MNATRKFGLALQFARGYAAKYPRPRPGTSERPPYRASDPLANNPKATVTTLEDSQLTFIHRPPPSAPTPHSLTTAPSSPLLRAQPRTQNGPLPPSLRPTANNQPPPVSDEVVAKIRELRQLNPTVYSRRKLAQMFSCTPNFVASIAALKKSQRSALVKSRDREHAEVRENWSEKKAIVRAIRAKRRAFW
ncbi:hypothetical protein BDN72DRAFT_761364 [Pluteus cervinus]|uniref:Uncharacterized protein n=1 Tax=Pluteus cervinus TaxID=181527 RepID=A0ACD3B688_9AGAR|nr:hypothetical protein BDN72DRAFT_761364 [Pluteus cervinus]